MRGRKQSHKFLNELQRAGSWRTEDNIYKQFWIIAVFTIHIKQWEGRGSIVLTDAKALIKMPNASTTSVRLRCMNKFETRGLMEWMRFIRWFHMCFCDSQNVQGMGVKKSAMTEPLFLTEQQFAKPKRLALGLGRCPHKVGGPSTDHVTWWRKEFFSYFDSS